MVRPMVEEATGIVRGSGRWPCKTWPTTLGLKLSVFHIPPGTSKWNKIEHRMFCQITKNWRGRPVDDHEIVVKLIAHTTTAKGLIVRAKLDRRRYPTKVKVLDATMATIAIKPRRFPRCS